MSRLIEALRRERTGRSRDVAASGGPRSAQTDSVLAALGYTPRNRRRTGSGRMLRLVAVSALVVVLAFGAYVGVNVYWPSSRALTLPPRTPNAPAAAPAAHPPLATPKAIDRVKDALTGAQDITPPEFEQFHAIKERSRAEVTGATTPSTSPTASTSTPAPQPTAPPKPTPPSKPTIRSTPAARTASSRMPAAPVVPAAAAPADTDHFKLAVYYQRAGDFENAMVHYRAVLERNELNAEAHNNLGLLYQQKGLLDQAVQEFQRAILIDGRYAKAHNNLGVTLLRMGNAEAAAAEFQAVLAVDSKNVDALVNLALTFKAAGRPAKAQETLLRAISLESRSAAAHYNLALLYEQDQEYASAIDHYRVFLAHAGAEYAGLTDDVRKRIGSLTSHMLPR